MGLADAFDPLAVVVVGARDPGRDGGLDDRGVQRIGFVARQHVPGAAGAVQLRRAAVEVLRAAEQRQDVVPAPAVVAEVRPVVVVEPVAADVDHPVDRARPAEDATTRVREPAAGDGGVRDRLVRPVDGAAAQLDDAAGIVDGRVRVRAARLQQGHARARVDQPPCDDGTRRPCADDDDLRALSHSPQPIPAAPPGRAVARSDKDRGADSLRPG